MEAPSLSYETAALQIHTVLWSNLAPLHQESERKLNSYNLLFDGARSTESLLMGSQASVTKHVSCSLMALSFHNGMFLSNKTSIFLCVRIRRF